MQNPSSSAQFRANLERAGPGQLTFRPADGAPSVPPPPPARPEVPAQFRTPLNTPHYFPVQTGDEQPIFDHGLHAVYAPPNDPTSEALTFIDDSLPAAETWQGFCEQITPSRVLAAAGATLGAACEGCRYIAGRFVHGLQAPRWERQAGSEYVPHQWKQYSMDGYKYDVVAYRRPKRGLITNAMFRQ